MLGFSRREANSSLLITHELAFMEATTSAWTTRIVRQEETLPLLGSPTKGDVKLAKGKIDPSVGKGRRLPCKSLGSTAGQP